MKKNGFIVGCAVALVLLATAILATCATTNADGSKIYKFKDFEYEKRDDDVWIVGYTGTSTVVDIPEVIRGKPVTEIRHGAFANKGLTAVSIPKTVGSIYGSIDEKGGFEGNQLTGIIIPGSLESIGSRAFRKNQLTEVIIPEGVRTIGLYAFAENQLTEVIIPEGVITIRANAFADNKLTHISIPKSVVSLGDNIVAGNPLAAPLVVPDHVETITFANGFEGEIAGQGNSRTITITRYYGEYRKVVVPAAAYGIPVTAIGEKIFVRQRTTKASISELVLPNSITSISNGVKSYCEVGKITASAAVAALWRNAVAAAEAKEREEELEHWRSLGRVMRQYGQR
jgi:hypothetical protein